MVDLRSNPGAILLKNPHTELHWLGWRANLYDLTSAGWDVSMQQLPEHYAIRIALRYDRGGLRCHGVSELCRDYHFMEMQDPYRVNRRLAVFDMQIASQIMFCEAPLSSKWGGFSPVETYPSLEPKTHSVDDFFAFRKISPEVEGIVLPEPTLLELLEKARALQEPKQRELREKFLREKHLEAMRIRQAGTVRAQLLQVA